MPYSRSFPLQRWMGERRGYIDTIEVAMRAIGEVDGPGRPLTLSRPIAHSYILRVIAEFQGFARDLHDLTAEALVLGSGVAAASQPLLINAVTANRQMDSGNADLRSLKKDFGRLGMVSYGDRLARLDTKWTEDRAAYQQLIELRNALAHGNQTQLDAIRSRSAGSDSVSATKRRLSCLNRMARAMDRASWDHVRDSVGRAPW